MKLHEIKLQSMYCDAVSSLNKTFEVRLNDRDYKVGDLVSFIPMNGNDLYRHPVSKALFKITYILPLQNNYIVFSIKRVKLTED